MVGRRSINNYASVACRTHRTTVKPKNALGGGERIKWGRTFLSWRQGEGFLFIGEGRKAKKVGETIGLSLSLLCTRISIRNSEAGCMGSGSCPPGYGGVEHLAHLYLLLTNFELSRYGEGWVQLQHKERCRGE